MSYSHCNLARTGTSWRPLPRLEPKQSELETRLVDLVCSFPPRSFSPLAPSLHVTARGAVWAAESRESFESRETEAERERERETNQQSRSRSLGRSSSVVHHPILTSSIPPTTAEEHGIDFKCQHLLDGTGLAHQVDFAARQCYHQRHSRRVVT